MKKIMLFLLTISFVSIAIYGEEYITRGFAILFGVGLIFLGFLLESVYYQIGLDDVWHELFLGMGCLLALFFFFTIGLTIHFIQTEDGVFVKSAFYTHVLESGQSVEKSELRSNYTQYHRSYDVDVNTYYFLYHGNTCSIYSMYRKIMEVDSAFMLEEKDFGHGELEFIKCGKDSFDLQGTKITDGYKPYVRDVTPDDTNYSNL